MSFAMRIAVLFMPAAALACSCAPKSDCEPVSRDWLAFRGTVTRVRTSWLSGSEVTADFSVAETFGKLGERNTMSVRTARSGPACGYPFQTGVEYLVFVHQQGNEFSTGSCSGTRPVVTAGPILRQLRAVKAGRAAAQMFGIASIEPYPGVSPASRAEAKPASFLPITALGDGREFARASGMDGAYEFSNLPPGTYKLRVKLPPDLLIWWGSRFAERQYEVRPGASCEVDILLYLRSDPFGRQ
jgi:hypothetical protein